MAASPTASSSSAPTAAAAAVAAEATDGPVLSVVSKRLRALRKKYNRITQMEESLAAGKTLNREQEEVLRSKPVVAALIEELERLRAPLASAAPRRASSEITASCTRAVLLPEVLVHVSSTAARRGVPDGLLPVRHLLSAEWQAHARRRAVARACRRCGDASSPCHGAPSCSPPS